jgi:hypothetical protein
VAQRRSSKHTPCGGRVPYEPWMSSGQRELWIWPPASGWFQPLASVLTESGNGSSVGADSVGVAVGCR